MARPGGNPDLVKYQFRPNEDAPLSKKELPDLKKAAGDSGYSMGFNC